MRRLAVPLLLFLCAAPLGAAVAQPAATGTVEVVDVSGLLDPGAVDLLVDSITKTDAQLVVLQLDAPGALTGDIEALIELVDDPPVPVAVWVGPAPARLLGGAAQVLAAAPIRAAAPGAEVGYLYPTVSGRRGEPPDAVAARVGPAAAPLLDEVVEVTGPVPGLVDIVAPSLGQLIVGLDGEVVATQGGDLVLATARASAGDGGPEVAVEVVFSKGPLLDRWLRAAAQPEAAFFFLVAGITLAAFEFYAAGVGLMGAVAAISLLLAGYGIGVLPVRWWAVALTVAGLLLYVADFQRSDLGWRSLAGTAGLAAGGLWFVDAAPHFAPSWWVVAGTILGAALFFGVGMTAVVRARFATRTIGRERLVGRVGTAESAVGPTGVVSVGGARWRARSTRAAGIEAGMPVEVTGVAGIELEVEPVSQ